MAVVPMACNDFGGAVRGDGGRSTPHLVTSTVSARRLGELLRDERTLGEGIGSGSRLPPRCGEGTERVPVLERLEPNSLTAYECERYAR